MIGALFIVAIFSIIYIFAIVLFTVSVMGIISLIGLKRYAFWVGFIPLAYFIFLWVEKKNILSNGKHPWDTLGFIGVLFHSLPVKSLMILALIAVIAYAYYKRND